MAWSGEGAFRGRGRLAGRVGRGAECSLDRADPSVLKRKGPGEAGERPKERASECFLGAGALRAFEGEGLGGFEPTIL